MSDEDFDRIINMTGKEVSDAFAEWDKKSE